MQQGSGRSSTTSSTSSRSTGSRCSTCRSAAARAPGGAPRPRGTSGSPMPSTTAWRSWPPPRPGTRGSWPRKPTRATSRQADPRLAEGQDAPGAGVRRRRLHQGQGRRARTLGSLVLAVMRGGQLEYVGNVGTGFTEDEIERLLRKLRPLERATSAFAEAPKMPKVRKDDVVWVEPTLVAESSSRSGPTTAACAPRFTGFARGQGTRRRCVERSRFRPRSSAEDARCASPTSTSRSGRRRASRRAT